MKTPIVMLLICVMLAGCQNLSFKSMPGPDHVIIHLANDGCPSHVRELENEGKGPPAARCKRLDNVKRADLICRQRDEEIIWRLPGNTEFSIDFKTGNNWDCSEGPGNTSSCCSTGPGNTYSCDIPTTATKKTYGYNVTANNCVLDPEILIY